MISGMAVKIVGRKKAARGWQEANRLLKLVIRLRGDKPFMPRGVYRFKTFEEAQEWSLKMMTRKRAK